MTRTRSFIMIHATGGGYVPLQRENQECVFLFSSRSEAIKMMLRVEKKTEYEGCALSVDRAPACHYCKTRNYSRLYAVNVNGSIEYACEKCNAALYKEA